LLTVACGGAAGAIFRFAISNWLTRTPAFPTGTLVANIAGCFVIGLFYGWGITDRAGRVRLFFCTGFLGALTTMSAFSIETVAIGERGERMLAAGYVLISVTGCLLMAMLGVFVARWLTPGIDQKG
jgi:CrcB protein